jgi:hypothetical protein
MRRRRTLVALGLVACAASGLGVGCAPGEPAAPNAEPGRVAPPPDFVSGSRLRARFHVIDGLVPVFTTFHDAALDVDCAYDDESGAHVGPGASSYCLPGGMARHREGAGPYLDLACTQRAAFTGSSGATSPGGAPLAPSAYVLVEPRDACTTAPQTYTALSPRRHRAFLRDDRGACVEIETQSVQPLGDAIPLETFVHAVEQVEPRDGRIAARVLVGDDGSRRVVGGFDRLRAEPSRVGTPDDGSRRWLPARVAFVGGFDVVFADAACRVPAATKIARTATCPLSAAVVLDGGCGAGQYYELGERLSTSFERDPANACVARPAPEPLAFALGPPVAAPAFEPVVTVDVGGARVRRRGVGAEGDLPVAWAEVVDVDSGEACGVSTAADGELRCLPAAAEVVSFFADAACTERAFAHALTGCEAGPGPRFVRDGAAVPARVLEVGRELAAVFTLEGGTCVQFAPRVPSLLFAASEIDPGRFAPAVLVAE